MIRPFKLPDNKIPIEVGDKSYIYKDVFNPIEWHYDEPYRVRVETLVLSKNGSSVFVRVKNDKTGYRLPGGSVDEDATFTQQAENETNEEALISITTPIKTNICYTKSMDRDFIKKGGDSPLAYVGAITHVYVATYTGVIDKSTIEEKDLDDDMAKNGKFHDIKDIVDILDKWHIEALLCCKNLIMPDRINVLQKRLDQLSIENKPNYIFESGGDVGGTKKIIYHGSLVKFDTFHPMSLDLGNAEQEPGWSTFCFHQYIYAKRFAIMRAMQKVLEEKKETTYMCGWDMCKMQPYLHKKIASEVFDALRGTPIYIYTVDGTNLELGIGNDERFPEVTFRDDNVVPEKVEKIILNDFTVRQDVTIIDVLPREYDKYQYKHMSDFNRGWIACMLNRDYSGDSAVTKLTKAVACKVLKPGMNVSEFMSTHGISLKDYSFYDRITESVFVRPVEFNRRIYLGDQKMIYSSEPIDCPNSYTDREEEEHASVVISPSDKELDDINFADVFMVYRGILYHINEKGNTYKVGFCDIHKLENESEKVLIGRIYVRPAFRRKGIGDVLYGYLRRFLVDSEFNNLQIKFYVSEKIYRVSSIMGWLQSKRLTLELDDCVSVHMYKSLNKQGELISLAESVIVNQKDLTINMDKWTPGTILWITGTSGDGKSTISQEYADENDAILVHADAFLCRIKWTKEKYDKKMKEWNATGGRADVLDPISLEYIAKHDKDLQYGVTSHEAMEPLFISYFMYLINTAKNDPRYNNRLIIVEGCDITFLDAEFMVTQPCIILGASRVTAAIRRIKRDVKKGDNAFVAVWKTLSRYNSTFKGLDDNKIRFRKEIESIISESTEFDDYPMDYGIVTSGDFADYAQYADLDSAMGPIEEGIVLNKDDIRVNIDKWERKIGHNILLITGLSGSGKTITSYEVAYDKKAEVFQLDWISQPQYMKDSPETPNYGLWQYVKKTTDLSSVDTLSPDELHNLLVEVFETIIAFANKNANKLFIVEGIQIPTHFYDYPNIDNFPIIIKGTSVLTSMFRRFMRDKKDAWVVGIGTESILQWYLKREKDIDRFKSRIIECNIVDISDKNITESYAHYVHVLEAMDANKFLKPVYIVLTYTATTFGKLITKFQNCKFSHAGIALSSTLDKIFTFNMRTETKEVVKNGKILTKKEIKGGADIESLSKYVNPEDNGDADICVMCVFVNPSIHKLIESNINKYFANTEKTNYSIANIFNIVMNKAVDSSNSMSMVCSQFVDNILKMAGIDITSKPSNLVTPNDFAEVAKGNQTIFILYDGKKTKYNPRNIDTKVRYIKNSVSCGELDITKRAIDPHQTEHQYFYHLVPKNADISKGITTLEWQYNNDIEMFRKNADKYRDRIVNGWGIFPGVDPGSLSDEEILLALKKFRKDTDGANRIYLFRYPPYVKLGPKMAAKLKQSDIYRIDISDAETSKYIKKIDWGYDGSHTGNGRLNQSYYDGVSKKSYFCTYDENDGQLLFSHMNHIAIIPRYYNSIPASCWTKIETPVTFDNVPDDPVVRRSQDDHILPHNDISMESSQEWRNKLPDSKFGLPEKRKYPLDTKEHVLSAIKFFNYAQKEDKEELAKNLNAGIEAFFDSGEYPNVGKDNSFYKYYNHKDEMHGEKVELAEAFTESYGMVVEGRPAITRYYIVSDKDDLDKTTIQPRVPDNFLTKNGYEDATTKRVCVTQSVGNCLTALSRNCTGEVLSVYVLDGTYNVYKPTEKQVPDVKITKEHWVTEPVKLLKIGVIQVTGCKDKDGLKYTYGDKTAELYEWEYEWIEQYIPNTLTESSVINKKTSKGVKLYHGSTVQGLKYIEPRQESVNIIVGNRNVIYASNDPRFSACFAVRWHDGIARQGTWDDWNTVTFGISDKVDLNKPCSLYELENDGNFTQIRTKEFISTHRVKVIKEIKYNTGKEMLDAWGVEVISLDEYKRRLNNVESVYESGTTMKSDLDEDFKKKGNMKLSSFTKLPATKENIAKYKSGEQVLRPVDSDSHGYLFVDNGNLVAVVAVENDDSVKNAKGDLKGYRWITDIEVLPKYRGYGLSKQLLDIAVNELKGDFLTVTYDNKVAIKLYQSYGFKITKNSYDDIRYGRSNSNMYLMFYKNRHPKDVEFIEDTRPLKEGACDMNKYDEIVSEAIYMNVTPTKERYYYDSNGIGNCLINIKEHKGALRGRGEILILSKDLKKYLICPVSSDSIYYQFGYRLPGGSFEEGKSHIDQITKEAEEEIHITVENVWDSGERYAFTYNKPPKWVMEKIPKDHWWYGSYVEIFVGVYGSKYTGDVAETDVDQEMLNNAKWITINPNNVSKLTSWHQRALANYLEYVKGSTEAVQFMNEAGIGDIILNALLEAEGDDDRKKKQGNNDDSENDEGEAANDYTDDVNTETEPETDNDQPDVQSDSEADVPENEDDGDEVTDYTSDVGGGEDEEPSENTDNSDGNTDEGTPEEDESGIPSEDEEDGATDYTDLDNDSEEGETSVDNSDDSSNIDDSQDTDNQSNNNRLKNYSLLKDFESLYRLANEIGDTIEPLIMEKPIQNKVLTKVKENLIMIKQSIKKFITMNFNGSYSFNLYCYEMYANALRVNIEILEKNKEFSEKIKEKKKRR